MALGPCIGLKFVKKKKRTKLEIIPIYKHKIAYVIRFSQKSILGVSHTAGNDPNWPVHHLLLSFFSPPISLEKETFHVSLWIVKLKIGPAKIIMMQRMCSVVQTSIGMHFVLFAYYRNFIQIVRPTCIVAVWSVWFSMVSASYPPDNTPSCLD